VNGDFLQKVRWRWTLPVVFVVMTGMLLALAPSRNKCHEVARYSDVCISLPELIASLANGPALCMECALQQEYFPDKYSSRLVGVFVMWFWVGWLLDEHIRRAKAGTRLPWIYSCTYAAAILLCAIRICATLRLDRVDWSYALRMVRESGAVVTLQAAGRIWVERFLVGWIFLFLVCCVRELRARDLAQIRAAAQSRQTLESPPG
jgi:hypothetical protein